MTIFVIKFKVLKNLTPLVYQPLHKKMKFSVKDFFSKCDQIRSFLQIWSDLLKKSLMENFIFSAVNRSLYGLPCWEKIARYSRNVLHQVFCRGYFLLFFNLGKARNESQVYCFYKKLWESQIKVVEQIYSIKHCFE